MRPRERSSVWTRLFRLDDAAYCRTGPTTGQPASHPDAGDAVGKWGAHQKSKLNLPTFRETPAPPVPGPSVPISRHHSNGANMQANIRATPLHSQYSSHGGGGGTGTWIHHKSSTLPDAGPGTHAHTHTHTPHPAAEQTNTRTSIPHDHGSVSVSQSAEDGGRSNQNSLRERRLAAARPGQVTARPDQWQDRNGMGMG